MANLYSFQGREVIFLGGSMEKNEKYLSLHQHGGNKGVVLKMINFLGIPPIYLTFLLRKVSVFVGYIFMKLLRLYYFLQKNCLFPETSDSGTAKDTFQFPSAGKRLPEIIILL